MKEAVHQSGPRKNFWSLFVVLMLVSELQLQVDNPSDRTNGLLRLLLLPPEFQEKGKYLSSLEKLGEQELHSEWSQKPSSSHSALSRMRMMMMMEGSSSFCPLSVPLSDRHTLLLPCNFHEVLALACGGSSCDPAAEKQSELQSCSLTLTEVVM